MTQNLRDFTQSVYLMDAVVRRVPGTAWSLSSPCEGWTARDVVGHVSAVLTAAAEMVVTCEMVLPETSGDLTDPEVLWTRARTSILSAIDEPGALTREGTFWFGPMSVDDLIGVVLWDPLTHAWDVATAVGIDPHLDEDLASVAFDRISSMRDGLAGMGLLGPELRVPDDASAIDRYLGLVGRDHLASR